MNPTVLLACTLALTAPALAADTALTLPAKGEAYAQPATPAPPAPADNAAQTTPAATTEAPQPARPGFGDPWWWGITLSTGYAWDFNNISQINIATVAVSTFIARDLELRGEVGGWAVLQEDQDTGGGSFMLRARWHVWHSTGYAWTAFVEGGLGFLYTGADVPEDGGKFNFTPELGGGVTMALGDSARDPRLELGLRWRHLSNARLQGDDQNPGVDSLMVFAGVTFSF